MSDDRQLLEFVQSRSEEHPGMDYRQLFYQRLILAMRACAEDFGQQLAALEDFPAGDARPVPGFASDAEIDTKARVDVLRDVCARFAAVFREDRDFRPGWDS